jgi:hypothetical protein
VALLAIKRVKTVVLLLAKQMEQIIKIVVAHVQKGTEERIVK